MIPLLLAAALTLPAPPPAGLPIDPAFAASPVWDDGKAEVAHYEAHRVVYGIDRSFETTLITVKEEFDARTAVKADEPYEGRTLTTVLKLNIVSRIPTTNYPYDYLTSIFVRRDDPRVLVKAAGSSQEWCGTTFKEVVTWDGPPRLLFHSYFDGQADGSHPIELDTGRLLEDQLLLVMRAVAPPSGEGTLVAVHESLISNAVPRAPAARLLSLVNAGEETVLTPAGRFETTRYDLRDGTAKAGAVLSYWIEKASRRALVRFTAADGRSLLLKEITRRDYWSR